MERPGAPASITPEHKKVNLAETEYPLDDYAGNLIDEFTGYYPARWADRLPVPVILPGNAAALGKVSQKELLVALETAGAQATEGAQLLGYPAFADPKTLAARVNVTVPSGPTIQVLVASSVSKIRAKVAYTPVLSLPACENGPALYVMVCRVEFKNTPPMHLLVPPSRIQDLTCCDQPKRIEKIPGFSAVRVDDPTTTLVNPAGQVLAMALFSSPLACEGKAMGTVVSAILKDQAEREVAEGGSIPPEELKEMAIDVAAQTSAITNWVEETIAINVRKRPGDDIEPEQPKRPKDNLLKNDENVIHATLAKQPEATRPESPADRHEPAKVELEPGAVDLAAIPQSEIDPVAWRAGIQMKRKERRAHFPPTFPEHMSMIDLPPYGVYVEAVLRMCQLNIMTISAIKAMWEGIPADAAEQCMREIGSSAKAVRDFIESELVWEREISAQLRKEAFQASRVRRT